MARICAPQTVGEALRDGWHALDFYCRLCRHKGRVSLADRPGDTLIARLIRRTKCRSCGARAVEVTIVSITTVEKAITCCGDVVKKVGMN